MNRFMTVLSAAFVALLIVAAGVFGAVAFRPTATQAAQAGPSFARSITVVGNGTSKAAPDTATVQVGVQSQAATAREALTNNSASMQALVDKLKASGIPANDIQTSNFSISPTYDNDGRSVTGYQVNNLVSVKIREIGKASELLDSVVEAGANNIYGMSFGFDDPSAMQGTARDNAITDARARAEAMAKASGASLGQVITITENVGSVPPVMPMAKLAEQAAGGAPAIEAGEQTVSAQVQITYELR